MILMSQGHQFDSTYIINHLSFGKDEDFKIIQRKFPDQGLIHPLDGNSGYAMKGEDSQVKNIMSNFYLIAVPSYYLDASGNQY